VTTVAGASARRPIPAIIFLVALSLVSALVWWRVLNRADSTASPSTGSTAATACATPTKSVTLPAPANVVVTVLNATGTAGLAGNVSDQLKARGFQVGSPGNDESGRTETATTEVRYGPAGATAGQLVQIFLPGSKLVQTTVTTADVTVSVGTTFVALATPEQVAAGVAAATKTC
jgi:hypothetical protein